MFIVQQNNTLRKVARKPGVAHPVWLAPFLPFQGIFFKEKKIFAKYVEKWRLTHFHDILKLIHISLDSKCLIA